MTNVDVGRRKSIGKEELHRLMATAKESGDFDLPRVEGSDHITPIGDMIATIMTRVEHVGSRDGEVINATDPDVLTGAEIAGRRQALEYARFLVARVPGYEDASLVALGTQIGVRETRRVYGDYRVTSEDVLSARQFDDQIGLCGAPIEDHHGGAGTGTTWEYLPDETAVGIPLASLIVEGFRQHPRGGSLLLGHPRCPCFDQVDGAMHGDGSSGRNPGSDGGCDRRGEEGRPDRGEIADSSPTARSLESQDREMSNRLNGHQPARCGPCSGDIDPGQLGVTYVHEHLIIDSPIVAERFPHIYLPSVEEAVAEAERARGRRDHDGRCDALWRRRSQQTPRGLASDRAACRRLDRAAHREVLPGRHSD